VTHQDDEQRDDTLPDKLDPEPLEQERREFLRSLGKWSQAVIGGVLAGGTLTPSEPARAWYNRGVTIPVTPEGPDWYYRGGGGWANRGGSWANRGGGWVNRSGSWYNRGGGWVNRGGGWYNRGGGWFNRGGGWHNRGGGWHNRGGGWHNRGGGGWANRGGGGWANRGGWRGK
jgi:hypothetical protein